MLLLTQASALETKGLVMIYFGEAS